MFLDVIHYCTFTQILSIFCDLRLSLDCIFSSLFTRPHFKGNSGQFDAAIMLVQTLFENCLL